MKIQPDYLSADHTEKIYWHSVLNSLPEKDGEYLCISKNGNVLITNYLTAAREFNVSYYNGKINHETAIEMSFWCEGSIVASSVIALMEDEDE